MTGRLTLEEQIGAVDNSGDPMPPWNRPAVIVSMTIAFGVRFILLKKHHRGMIDGLLTGGVQGVDDGCYDEPAVYSCQDPQGTGLGRFMHCFPFGMHNH
jgi:hypothetical protein